MLTRAFAMSLIIFVLTETLPVCPPLLNTETTPLFPLSLIIFVLTETLPVCPPLLNTETTPPPLPPPPLSPAHPTRLKKEVLK